MIELAWIAGTLLALFGAAGALTLLLVWPLFLLLERIFLPREVKRYRRGARVTEPGPAAGYVPAALNSRAHRRRQVRWP